MIGISGASRSGKGQLATRLKSLLKLGCVRILSQDDFYYHSRRVYYLPGQAENSAAINHVSCRLALNRLLLESKSEHGSDACIIFEGFRAFFDAETYFNNDA